MDITVFVSVNVSHTAGLPVCMVFCMQGEGDITAGRMWNAPGKLVLTEVIVYIFHVCQ